MYDYMLVNTFKYEKRSYYGRIRMLQNGRVCPLQQYRALLNEDPTLSVTDETNEKIAESVNFIIMSKKSVAKI